MLTISITVFLSALVISLSPVYAQNQTMVNQTEIQMQPQTQEWSTYEDPILGISIQYPEDWEVEEGPNMVIFRHIVLDNGSESTAASTLVSAEPRLEGVETSEEFMKSVMNELRGVEKLEIHDINVTMVIDGKNTSKIDTIQGESGDFHNNDYFIVDEANDTMHRLSFITRENRYAEYQPIFDRMATSFRVQ